MQLPWVRHHNLRGAGDGFIWPNLSLLPEGGYTRAVWYADDDVPDHARVRYMAQGERFVRTPFVEMALREIVDSTITRLEESGLRHTALQKEWSAIRATPADERDFCLAAARLGLDPYSLADGISEKLVAASERLGKDLLDEYLDAIDVDLMDDGVRWVEESSDRIDEMAQPGGRRPLPALVTSGSDDTSAYLPWERGYQEAAKLREMLNLSIIEAFAVEEFFAVAEHQFVGRGLQALAARSNGGEGALVLAKSVASGPARFTEARALWHLLHEPNRDRFLITENRSDRNRTARAFAAELLAPASGIADRIDADPSLATQSDIEQAAEHFRVSPVLIQHQIQNQLAYA